MATPAITPQIDPATGERVKPAGAIASPQIDPNTGERVKTGASLSSAGASSGPSAFGKFAGDVGKGLGESALSTLSAGDDFARKHLPAFLTNSNMGFGPPANLQHVHDLATPANTTQALSKGAGDAAQFLIPGGAEEKVAAMAPKAVEPLARIATSALGSGAVNKAEGGSFGTGAALGAGGQVIGQGLKAAAPALTEGALGITKAMRGRGREIGQAVLDETNGIRPESIADSAKNKISSLYGERQGILDNASVKPNPVKGLLPAPAQEIALPSSPNVKGRASQPITLQSNRAMPREFAPYGTNDPNTPTWGNLKAHEYMGEIPGERGGPGQPQGVLLRPGASGGGPVPAMLPNSSASLRPARDALSEAVGKARGMEAPTLHGQVSNMSDFLHVGAVSGEPIPANITPSHLGRLQQGFSDEHLTWNPNTHEMANAAGQKAYGAMTGELGRVAPETVPLNRRISNLIPAQRGADSMSRGAPVIQKVMGRVGAHTGAMTLGGLGAAGGYHEGGVPGAIVGGLTGVLAPELMASPEGQMMLARSMNKAGAMRPAVGLAAQFDRKKGTQ